ncbi:GYDIA family GHMP kinase [Lacinutrix neustonica]|uniref:GYDIA family GHMP kinase n=1 Tax=Lacinutrix neustonica TaxID=2980107 RepID=A0A9E8SD78_9FLAO|nr:GYDIA family GHMP kinase [Lacinutrix neustonica]WAC01427.1 GYDIA family GHMP kinase [Lacinutrix neustonica]
MQRFYSHGKLLLTGEYVVLDGAKALALPTKFGQMLTVEVLDEPKIKWQSLDDQDAVWFEDEFVLVDEQTIQSQMPHYDRSVSSRLIELLQAAQHLKPTFLSTKTGYNVTSKLEFPSNWGLGSSSTLINNIAQWAQVDAFALSNATFGGSGYDIACAQQHSPIVYERQHTKPKLQPIIFNKAFKNDLFFIHLNQKQDSRESIKTYQENKTNSKETILKINEITQDILDCATLNTFETLIEAHETLIGTVTNQTPVKQRLFNDYQHAIKSPGGWGGDFILATGHKKEVHSYFKSKGYHTIMAFQDIILE